MQSHKKGHERGRKWQVELLRAGPYHISVMLYNTFICFPVEFLASTQVRSAPYALFVGNTPMKELGLCMHVGLQPLNNLLFQYKRWDGEHQSLRLDRWDSLWPLPEFVGHHQNPSLFIYNVTEHQWEVIRKADSTAIFKKGDRWELVITGHTCPTFQVLWDTSSRNEIADFVEKGTDFNLSSSFKAVRDTILQGTGE